MKATGAAITPDAVRDLSTVHTSARRHRFVIATLAGVALCLCARSAAAQSMLIGVDDLSAALTDPAIVVLHVAERAAAFEEGHIPGARFVRYGDFAVPGADEVGSELPAADVIRRVFEAAGVSDGSRVVIYAQSPVMAARAFFTLDAFGHSRVALLDGGLRAWRAANKPVDTGASPAARSGRFTPRLNETRLADAAFIQRQTPGQSIALVDVRPDDEFSGSNTMGGAHAPGHIAGARQLTWNSLVGPDGLFLSRDELKKRLASAGAAPGRPVVAYCMVGMRASVVYFVARLLGHDVKLYDGSIVDWSRRNLPTVRN
jgi:thiosulfate/3-mercaptopyruvate sulfurtransferase